MKVVDDWFLMALYGLMGRAAPVRVATIDVERDEACLDEFHIVIDEGRGKTFLVDFHSLYGVLSPTVIELDGDPGLHDILTSIVRRFLDRHAHDLKARDHQRAYADGQMLIELVGLVGGHLPSRDQGAHEGAIAFMEQPEYLAQFKRRLADGTLPVTLELLAEHLRPEWLEEE